jgi:hypothetical protein
MKGRGGNSSLLYEQILILPFLHLSKKIDHVLNDIMELHTKPDGRFFATIAVSSKFQQYIAVLWFATGYF